MEQSILKLEYDDKKRSIKWLCREIAKIDRECERLAKEKLELQLEIARIGENNDTEVYSMCVAVFQGGELDERTFNNRRFYNTY